MNHELEQGAVAESSTAVRYERVELSAGEVKHLRHLLHELANVLTGIMVTGGLLHQALKGDLRQRYTAEICTGGDRGAELVREARAVLMVREDSRRASPAENQM